MGLREVLRGVKAKKVSHMPAVSASGHSLSNAPRFACTSAKVEAVSQEHSSLEKKGLIPRVFCFLFCIARDYSIRANCVLVFVVWM